MGINVYPPVSGGGGATLGFNLDVGSSGNTTFEFSESQPAGGYSITSQLADSTIEFYAIAEDGTLAGYTNSKALTATKDFNKMVVYGATSNDLITFEFKETTLPSSSGGLNSGAGPFLTSATPTTLPEIDDTTTVTGGNFSNNVEIIFTGQDDIDRPAKNIVRSSSTSLIVTRPDNFPVTQEPYTITATNSGIPNPTTGVNILTDYFDAGSSASWVTASTLPNATITEPYSTTIQATDADGSVSSYALTAGALPAGLSFNGSTGVISGTVTNPTPGTFTFTITSTDSGGNNSERQFSLTTVFATVTADLLVIAGGGAGGESPGGGGGAGGYREFSGIAIPKDQALPIRVGAGGAMLNNGQPALGAMGNNSLFYNISASGGGGGADHSTSNAGLAGGSGGGGSIYGGPGGAGNVGEYDPVEGYAGGSTVSYLQAYPGSGGGGAGGVGGNGTGAAAGSGGPGRASSITGTSVSRAGGGAGGLGNVGGQGSATSGGGGPNNAGTANTGGGGGGRGLTSSGGSLPPVGSYSTNGGSGVIIIRYPNTITAVFSQGVTHSTTTSGSFKVTTITATSTTSETIELRNN